MQIRYLNLGIKRASYMNAINFLKPREQVVPVSIPEERLEDLRLQYGNLSNEELIKRAVEG